MCILWYHGEIMVTIKTAKILGVIILALAVLFVVLTFVVKKDTPTNLMMDESGNMVPVAPLEASGETLEYSFICPEGGKFTTSYDLGANAITLKINEVTYLLPQAVTESGALYRTSDGNVVYTERDGKSSVEVSGELLYVDCVVEEKTEPII